MTNGPTSSLSHAAALESLLVDLLRAHEDLLVASHAQRDAVRSADAAQVRAAADQQAMVLRQIASLEERRRELVGAMTAGSAFAKRPQGAGPVTLTELACHTPEPHRTRLIDLAGEVRQAVQLAADQQRTLKSATASLLAHMEGLMRQVAQRLSHAGTYGRRGMIESVPAVVSGLDLVT